MKYLKVVYPLQKCMHLNLVNESNEVVGMIYRDKDFSVDDFASLEGLRLCVDDESLERLKKGTVNESKACPNS